jgi:hypothetical protein
MAGYLYLAREALRYRYGVRVPCSDPQRLRLKLYAERKTGTEPELDNLEFRISPLNPDKELWILPVRRKGVPEDS